MGIDSRLLASVFLGVLCQRLARRICNDCKTPYPVDEQTLAKYFTMDDNREIIFYKGKGCPACHHTGYTGAVVLHEVLTINQEQRNLLENGASLQQVVEKDGFRTFRYDGMKKVLRGLTTIEELERVTAPDGIYL
jgi:type IV pilus assembly protein PilB